MTAQHRRVRRLTVSGTTTWCSDQLAIEEPLEIRVNGRPLTVTMRTPGADFDLVVGFLITEGLIAEAAEVSSMRACPHAADDAGSLNVVEVTVRGAPPTIGPARGFAMTAACGICGKASIDAVRTASRHDLRGDQVRIPPAVLAALPDRLRRAQPGFTSTGGLHAAALFTAGGDLLCAREDIGRHNAVDKVVGWAATQGRLPLREHAILVSGRAGFELVQKALMAGVPVMAAVSAPSSLAAGLADSAGMTLVGFLRGEQMNVYAGHERVQQPGVAGVAPR